jgi:hypothetical protein
MYIRSVPRYKQCTPFSISVTPQGDLHNRSFPLQIRLLLPRENSRTMQSKLVALTTAHFPLRQLDWHKSSKLPSQLSAQKFGA